MKLSILIPVFNESESIAELLRRVAAVPLEKEVIVVNDGSFDGTTEILNQLPPSDIKVIHHPHNMGKGAAINTALAAATGNVIVFQDADLEYNPQDFVRLIEPIKRGETKVTYGVRSLHQQSLIRRLGNRFLTLATRLLFRAPLHDMETCYKMIAKEVIDQFTIRSTGFEIEPEVTAKILKRGYAIVEVPITYTPRTQRKLKIWRDGPRSLWALIKYRFIE
jgi:dolichol-phosphate mannosyltransferase